MTSQERLDIQPAMAVCGSDDQGNKPSCIEQGYELLDDVENLLKILRSDRVDLAALEQLKGRFDALAATFPDAETEITHTVNPAEEQEKERLRQELDATNAEMKRIIDAYRLFQQDYGILFPSSEPLPFDLCAPLPHSSAPSSSSSSSSRP